jgi:hypothetical protein
MISRLIIGKSEYYRNDLSQILTTSCLRIQDHLIALKRAQDEAEAYWHHGQPQTPNPNT